RALVSLRASSLRINREERATQRRERIPRRPCARLEGEVMKRFIEVSRRSGNRIITQRYPAREVAPASVVQRAFARLSDRRCRCGYTVCSGTGPCAPKPAEQSRPCCTDAAKGAECGCLEDYTSRWHPE